MRSRICSGLAAFIAAAICVLNATTAGEGVGGAVIELDITISPGSEQTRSIGVLREGRCTPTKPVASTLNRRVTVQLDHERCSGISNLRLQFLSPESQKLQKNNNDGASRLIQ